jgi:hypothetical protein
MQAAEMKKIKRVVTDAMTPHNEIREILRWLNIILEHRREVVLLDGLNIVVDTHAVRKLSPVKLWKVSHRLKTGVTVGLREVYGEKVSIEFS